MIQLSREEQDLYQTGLCYSVQHAVLYSAQILKLELKLKTFQPQYCGVALKQMKPIEISPSEHVSAINHIDLLGLNEVQGNKGMKRNLAVPCMLIGDVLYLLFFYLFSTPHVQKDI